MTALFNAARAFAKLYPTRPASRDSGTWDQLCGILMIQFGGYLGGATAEQMRNYSPHVGVAPFWARSVAGDISSAYRVAMNSGPLNPTAALAPVGAFHFFNIGGADNGHVGIDLNGGGTEVFMATSALAESWGSSIGVNSVWGYMGTKRAPYLGWSTNYGGGVPKLPAPPRLEPYQRVVNSGGVSIRVEPTSQSAKVGFFPPKQVVSFIGWSKGELVEGVDIWFKVADQKWCWAGGFEDAGTYDLPDLTPKPEPEPEPEPTPEPEPPVVVPPVEPPTPTPQPDKPEPEPKPSNPALNWIIYLIGGVIAAAIGLWAIITGGQP